MITLAKVGATWAEECPSSPSNFWWVSWVLLAMRNSPADQKDEVVPEISCAKTVKSGAVRPMTQEIEKSSTAHNHRQRKSEIAGFGLLESRQFSGKNRDEDDIVDAKNNFQSEQCRKSNPCLRVRYPIRSLLLPIFCR